MARGQYDLPLNRASPVYGPSRPPHPQASRATRSPTESPILSPQSRPTVLVLSVSGTAISRTQLATLKARVQPEAAIQLIDTADATIAALSRKPTAVVVLDNAIGHPTFELARAGIIQYAQNGGRLITDIACSNMAFGSTTVNERRVEYKMKDVNPELRVDHLMT